jgi:hypothetical protein
MWENWVWEFRFEVVGLTSPSPSLIRRGEKKLPSLIRRGEKKLPSLIRMVEKLTYRLN